MKIAVCMKPVPATDTRVKIAADGKHLDPAGVSMVINPYDEFAIEEALKLKEAHGGDVVLVTVGPASFQATIKNGLAMGADSAVLLGTQGEPDSLQVARALAAELKDKGYDLVLCGKQAVDDDEAQVAPMLGVLLGLPCVTVVTKLELSGTGAGAAAKAQREIEGGLEDVTFALPAVVACQKGLNEPRYPSLKGIMAAKKKTIEERPAALGDAGLEVVSLALPAERSAGKIVGEGAAAVPELVRLLREEAKVI
ncbi:MAG: electron transfer flavoprotein subunit beta/FixA family protein [Candidatus Eiseniibacteriota bacterium]